MKTTAMPTSACPTCGYVMDQASSVEGEATPKTGDFSVCMRCGELLRFNAALHVRLASDTEVNALPKNLREMLYRTRRAVLALGSRARA